MVAYGTDNLGKRVGCIDRAVGAARSDTQTEREVSTKEGNWKRIDPRIFGRLEKSVFYGVSFDADGQPIGEQVERGSQHHVMLNIQLSVPTLSNAT